MDIGSQQQINLDSLSQNDKRELQQTLNQEMQKAKLHEAIHNLTETCWKKCVTGPIKQKELDRYEAPCMQNCVDRFLDANESVLKHLTTMRGEGAV